MIIGTLALVIISAAIFGSLGLIEAVIASNSNAITVIFGSMGGIAALIVAINTWLIRREAKTKADLQLYSSNRMDTFETSQASLQAALLRSDTENDRLRKKVSEQDSEIEHLKAQVEEIPGLKQRIGELEHEIEELKHGR